MASARVDSPPTAKKPGKDKDKKTDNASPDTEIDKMVGSPIVFQWWSPFLAQLSEDTRRIIYNYLFSGLQIHVYPTVAKTGPQHEKFQEYYMRTAVCNEPRCAHDRKAFGCKKFGRVRANILFVCRQTFKEGIRTLYRDNRFNFDKINDFCLWGFSVKNYMPIVRHLDFSVSTSARNAAGCVEMSKILDGIWRRAKDIQTIRITLRIAGSKDDLLRDVMVNIVTKHANEAIGGVDRVLQNTKVRLVELRIPTIMVVKFHDAAKEGEEERKGRLVFKAYTMNKAPESTLQRMMEQRQRHAENRTYQLADEYVRRAAQLRAEGKDPNDDDPAKYEVSDKVLKMLKDQGKETHPELAWAAWMRTRKPDPPRPELETTQRQWEARRMHIRAAATAFKAERAAKELETLQQAVDRATAKSEALTASSIRAADKAAEAQRKAVQAYNRLDATTRADIDRFTPMPGPAQLAVQARAAIGLKPDSQPRLRSELKFKPHQKLYLQHFVRLVSKPLNEVDAGDAEPSGDSAIPFQFKGVSPTDAVFQIPYRSEDKELLVPADAAQASGDGVASQDTGLPDDGADPADVEIVDADIDEDDEELPDAEPVDAEPVDAEPVDAQPVDAQPVDAASTNDEPVDAEPTQAVPSNATPVQGQAAPANNRNNRNTPKKPKVFHFRGQHGHHMISPPEFDPEMSPEAIWVQSFLQGYAFSFTKKP